ncbi:MAG: AAA family ATPase [Ignavibacteriaceae bacterium]|jgi:flagellar biosynthesis protein FlhG|nr:AAA family ATPase [Ignavibacteriaceae bacterium]
MNGQAERVFELQRLEKRLAGQNLPRHSKIFAFTSGKGGTGKTFLSVNMAFALSIMGKKILLVDFDCNFSNVHILMNVIATKTLSLFFLNKNLLPELITEVEPNLSVIFGDSGMQDFPKLSAGSIVNFFGQLRNLEHEYDFIFIDTASGTNKETLEILSQSDHTIVITSPEPTAVMDAYVVIKLLDGVGFTGEKNIVVNKSEDKNLADLTFLNLKTAVDHFLKTEIKFLGFAGNDAAVSRSIMAQTLLMKQTSNLPSEAGSLITLQISELAANLIKYIHVANIKQAG